MPLNSELVAIYSFAAFADQLAKTSAAHQTLNAETTDLCERLGANIENFGLTDAEANKIVQRIGKAQDQIGESLKELCALGLTKANPQ